ETLPHRFRLEKIGVDPAAVVAHLDVDEPASMVRVEREPAPWRLGAGATLGFRLDAVGDGVLQEMEDGPAHLLDDDRVHLDGFAARLEADVLAGRPGKFPDLSRDPREHLPHRHQPGARDLAAQAAREALDLRGVLRQAAPEARDLSLDHGEILSDLRQAPA